ncbi:MAG: collagenase [Gammaproteobacteria bacterium]|nr:collagenase [Gammaproteobacteria bacterium]
MFNKKLVTQVFAFIALIQISSFARALDVTSRLYLQKATADESTMLSRTNYRRENVEHNKHRENKQVDIALPDNPKHTLDMKHRLEAKSKSIACDAERYNNSGSQLLDAIKDQDLDCIDLLFGEASDRILKASFTEANIMTVTDHLERLAPRYDGYDKNERITKLLYWMRAFYYYDNRGLITPANQEASTLAIDELFNSSHIFDNTKSSGSIVNHISSVLNNALIGEKYVRQLKVLLSIYDDSYEKTDKWGNGLANLSWTTLASCARLPDCRKKEHKNSLVNALSDFIENNINWLDTPATDYHLHNIGYQLGNIYRSKDDAHFSNIDSNLETRISKFFERFGPLKSDLARRAYLSILTGVDDNDACEIYNLCSKKEELINLVLSNRKTCPSERIFIIAQDMNKAQLNWTCQSLTSYETHFHEKMETYYSPVVPDDNDRLRIVVFNNKHEWELYGGLLFGASTNNGGLYLEGDPGKPGDQATFFAYEDVPERPVFDIWNLRHEYIHYLDGRYVTHGDFYDMNDAGRTVWYGEGVGEYLSLKDCNDDAADAAKEKTYALSTIFKNEYGVGQDRIYRWGYLAVRYMYEEQNNQFFDLLEVFKKGRWNKYRNDFVDKWVDKKTFDRDFANWLTTVKSTGCTIDNTRPPSPIEPIDVDDVQGDEQVGFDACAAGRPPESDEIFPGKAVCLENTDNGEQLQMATYVPRGLVNVTMQITLRHGSGNSDLLHKYDGRPSETNYDYASKGPTTTETILVENVKPGWNYIHVKANEYFSNVTLLTRFIQNDEPNVELEFQAEESSDREDVKIRSRQPGYTGSGYVDYGGNGSWIEWNNIKVDKAGDYRLTITFSNGKSAKRKCAIVVNSESQSNIKFPTTGSWGIWKAKRKTITLEKGLNTLRIQANTDAGGPNIDRIILEPIAEQTKETTLSAMIKSNSE